MPCNINWKFMTGLMVMDMAVSLFASCAWGLGMAASAMYGLRDKQACGGTCLKTAQVTIGDVQLFAVVLYAVTAVVVAVAIVGLLAGELWLQVPNVAMSFVRLVGSLVIGEYLVQVNMGISLFTYNRVIVYFCLVVNFIIFTCNFAQANQEFRRRLMESRGLIEPEIRPLTNVIGPVFGTPATCCICTPPTIAEGVFPEVPEQVVEAAHHTDELDAELSSAPGSPEIKMLVDSESDLKGAAFRSGASPQVQKVKDSDLSGYMDDQYPLDIEYAQDEEKPERG